MKKDTYYSKNRDKILEKEKNKKIKENLETKLKRKEYNRNYYIEVLKERRRILEPKLDNKPYKKVYKKPVKDYSVKVLRGSFIINFD
tara:strand:- start:576 stop:836 length:261 start_codon:yes stop_codon:yes gene_type:complete